MHAPSSYRRRLQQTGKRLCAILVLALAPSLSVVAQSSSSVEELVEQLGSASFEQREQAEVLLLQRGAEVLDSLRKAAEQSDLETRYRARRLIARIEHEQQWRLLERFFTDYDPELAQQLPGWSRFAELVGDDLPARKLFAEMFESEPEIMSSLGRPNMAVILEKRVLEMQPAPNVQQQTRSVPPASTAVLLLASLAPGSDVTSNTRSLIHSQVNESEFQRSLREVDDPPIRRLLTAWVAEAKEISPSIRMNIGSRFQLSTAVVPAIELIDSQVHNTQLQYAVFTIAKLGTAEHVPALQRLLSNTSVLSERQRGDEAAFTCQVRDVALAGLIHLIGKQPREFGFTELRPNSNSLYALNTAGFASEELRETAFRKWRLWEQVQHRDGLDVGDVAVAGVRL